MAPIRVGIVGLGASDPSSYMPGSWGIFAHLRSLQALSAYEIVAVANSSVESAQRSIDFHKLPATTKAYGNPNDIVADPNVDLVAISVEVGKHYLLTKPALEHKKSVFVEWPLGVNVAEAEELTNLASANGVKTIVGLQARCDPLVQKVRELLASKKIGELTSSTVTCCTSHLPMDVWLKGVEYCLDWKSGGNEFSVVFGHFLDSFTDLLGDFDQVQGLLKSQINSVPILDLSTGQIVDPAYHKTAPDHILIQGTLKSNAVASIAFRKAKSAADKTGLRWYITGTEGEIVITTEEGNWQFGSPSERLIKLKLNSEAKAEEIEFGTELAAKVAFPGTNSAILYESFSQGKEVPTFESALKTHRLLERIASSAGWEY